MSGHLAIVGGGITGLAAAWEAANTGASVTVFEADERLGGKLLTAPFSGRPVDAGADAFLTRVPWGLELCEELGLTELTSPVTSTAYVLSDGRLCPFPPNTVLGVPTNSVGPPLPPPPMQDASIGSLVRERFGDEIADRSVAPLIGGISAGDIDHLSVRAVAPQLVDAASRPPTPLAEQGRIFASPTDGMGGLVEHLTRALRERGVDLRRRTTVNALEPSAGGGWSLQLPAETIKVDAVILAVPAFAATPLVAGLAPDATRLLHTIDYASVALVTLAFIRGDIRASLDGSGFLVPPSEGLLLTACSWYSAKWGLPPDPTILRLSAGRHRDERIFELDDDELVRTLLDELNPILSIAGTPSAVRVTRWPRSMPQYEVGHLQRVAAIEDDLATRAPGVRLAGAALRGVGVPSCIRDGRLAVHRVLPPST